MLTETIYPDRILNQTGNLRMYEEHFFPDEIKGLIDKCQVGNHICTFYNSEEERNLIVSYFIFIGLEKGEKVFYIDASGDHSEIESALSKLSIDVESATASGQLTIADRGDTYLLSGYFDLERTTKFWVDLAQLAEEEGYSGLRVAGDVPCSDDNGSIIDAAVEYESQLNHIFPGSNALALCLYNRSLFSDEALLNILCAHPFVINKKKVCDNHSYIPPEDWSEPNPANEDIDTLLDLIFEKNKTSA